MQAVTVDPGGNDLGVVDRTLSEPANAIGLELGADHRLQVFPRPRRDFDATPVYRR